MIETSKQTKKKKENNTKARHTIGLLEILEHLARGRQYLVGELRDVVRSLCGQLEQGAEAEHADLAIVEAEEGVHVGEPLLEKVEEDGAAVVLAERGLVERLQDDVRVAPEGGYDDEQAHGAQLGAGDLTTHALEHDLQERGQHVVDLVVALEYDDLEELGRVALGLVVVHVGAQHLLDHLDDDVEATRVRQKGVRVHGHVVVEHGHELGEEVDGVVLEYVVDEIEDAPHVVADLLGGERADEREELLVEVEHAVLNDRVDDRHHDLLQLDDDLSTLRR